MGRKLATTEDDCIRGVGEVTALTWVLEIGEPERFGSIRKAISYCRLCSGQNESAGKNIRMPISKKRNKHLQSVLIEAAKLAPHVSDTIVIHPVSVSRSAGFPNLIFCDG